MSGRRKTADCAEIRMRFSGQSTFFFAPSKCKPAWHIERQKTGGFRDYSPTAPQYLEAELPLGAETGEGSGLNI